MSDERITSLETRVGTVEKAIDKIDENQQRLWERMDQHREGQIRTQTIVEGISKDVGDVRVQISKLADAQARAEQNAVNAQIQAAQTAATAQVQAVQSVGDVKQESRGRWESFYSKAFWLLMAGGVSAIAAYTVPKIFK